MTTERKTFNDYGIHIPSNRRGNQIRVTCPQCSPYRAKRNVPCLAVNVNEGTFFCHHCSWSGKVSTGVERMSYPVQKANKDYTKPNYEVVKSVKSEDSSRLYSWFEKRGISKTIVDAYGIYMGQHYMVAAGKKVWTIQYPYFLHGEVINIKYRDSNKNFQMVGGAQRILYGLDDCKESDVVFIVEGEMDKLSLAECGIKACVSVPDGAPAVNASSYGSKIDFLDTDEAVNLFSRVHAVYLACDNDAPGIKLREELAARIGRDKCFLVEFPDGCKDANDVLVKFGKEALISCIEGANAYPVEGIVEVDELSDQIDLLYRGGLQRGVDTGWDTLNEYYSVKTGYWTLVTGIPQHGKSEWLDALMVNLAKLYDWKFGVCSPENHPMEYHFSKLAEKYIGKPFSDLDPRQFGYNTSIEKMSEGEVELAKHWVGEHFSFISPERPTLAAILELARILVLRKGIKGLVIDPWNQLDHSRPNNMSETEYISVSLTAIARFARFHDIHIWVVAHPKMLQKLADGTYPVPTPYDVSGSAHWYNKSDFAVAVHRDVSNDELPVEVYIQKRRLKHCGKIGVVPLRYNKTNGTYSELDSRTVYQAFGRIADGNSAEGFGF